MREPSAKPHQGGELEQPQSFEELMVGLTTPSILYASLSCVLKVINLYPWSFYEIQSRSKCLWTSAQKLIMSFSSQSARHTSFVRVFRKGDGHSSLWEYFPIIYIWNLSRKDQTFCPHKLCSLSQLCLKNLNPLSLSHFNLCTRV